MNRRFSPVERYYRLWIGQTGRWQPRSWQDVPTRFLAPEPVDDRAYSGHHALAFLEGFNGRMLAENGRHWAVAVAIEFGRSKITPPRRLFSGPQLRRAIMK